MITKEQWGEIEKGLSGSFGAVKFKLGEKEITLEKRFIKENVLAICVFIDSTMNPAMGWSGKHFDPIVETLWTKRSRSVYSPTEQKRIIKAWGKREAKKYHDIDKKVEWYEPFFKTFASMQRKYKKLDGLEFVQTDFVNL